MPDEDRTIRVRLLAEIGNYVDGLKKASLATATFGKEVSGHGKTVQADVERVGHSALLMSAGVAAGLALSAKAAIDWESAWTGVKKTVNASTADLNALEDELRGMAAELPATHQEIAAVAEAAGQLGIQTSAIAGFTRTMIDLGETTDLTADQAATAMAQIANVMQTPQTQFDNMGSALVALGNAGASTESQILELANRMAAAGHMAGLSESDILAFGSALSSVGIDAEAGGSAMSKVFTTISDAVKDGGDNLIVFGRVAGMTADQFKAAYEKDAAGAINSFIDGLGKMADSGQSLTPVMEALHFTDIRLMNALKSTATAGELLTQSLDLSKKAWEENTALTKEAEQRYDTFASKAEMARNQLVDLGITVGDHLLPVLSQMLDVGSGVIRGFGELDGAAGHAVEGVGGLAAASLGLIGILGTFGPKYLAFKDGLSNMGSLGETLAGSLGKTTLALGAVGLAVGAYTYALGQNAKRKQAAVDLAREYADAIRDETGALNENIDSVTAQKLGESPISTELRDIGADFDVLLGGIRETGDGLKKLSSQFQVGQLTGDFKTQLKDAGLAGTEFGNELQRLYDMWGQTHSKQFDDFLNLLGNLGAGYSDGAVLASNLAAAQSDVGDSASDAAPKQDQLAASLGLTSEEAKGAEDAVRDLMDAYRASVDPLFGMLDALDKNREAQRAQADAAAEGAQRVADARDALAEAQHAYNEARKGGDEEAIRAALKRVNEAQKELTDTQKDAAVTAEEAAKFNRDVAKSALDVEAASQQLAFAIQNGTVQLSDAKDMLADWVQEGLITEDQARKVAEQFDAAAKKADEYSGDYIANAYMNTEQAKAALDDLGRRLDDLNKKGLGTTVATVDLEKRAMRENAHGAAMGGVVGNLGRPGPTDTEMTWLTPGEGVVNLQGMSLLGPSGLDALNSGRLNEPPAGSMTDSRAYDHSQTWAPQFIVDGSRGARDTAGSIEFRMRTMQLELANR